MEDRKHSPLPFISGPHGMIFSKSQNRIDGGRYIGVIDSEEGDIDNDYIQFLVVRSVNLSDKYEALERAAEPYEIDGGVGCGDEQLENLRSALSALQEAKKSLPKEGL